MSIDAGKAGPAGLTIREAEQGDIPAIVALFSADEFGHGDAYQGNETLYDAAFRTIADSANSTLYVVAESATVVGTFMLTFMPALYGRGAHRMILEGVQVHPERRSGGIGRFILDFAERSASGRGAKSVVLTSNKRRHDAHRFYERNGYHKGHDGFKKLL